jgi:amino acid adenylation domain-containing protein
MEEDRWNATDRPYPRHLLLHQLVERHAASTPECTAVAHGDDQVSYRALVDRARQWSRRLRAVGVGADQRVGVHLARGPELVAALLGVLGAGGAYVPLDPAYPTERLTLMLDDSGVTALVTDDRELAAAARHRVPVLRLRPPDGPPPRREAPAAPGATPSSLAYALYTSGSTGRPKGIGVTHANVVDMLHWAAEAFGDDLRGLLAAASVSFDMSVIELFGPLSCGGTVVLVDSPVETARGAADPRVRMVQAVPSVLTEVLREEALPATVRTVVSGGEVLPSVLLERIRDGAPARVVNTYGPAECTSKTTATVLGDDVDGPPPIGVPVANHRCYVLDGTGRPVPPGKPGELAIAGRGVARGYLGRPALTAERFVPEPFGGRRGERMYRSGDLVRRDATGLLQFVGRVDHQVKVRGVRIEPAEVEHALVAHPRVHAAAVVARGSGDRRSLVAYVVPDAAPAPVADLLAHLRGVLPPGLVPDTFVELDRLPRTPNGKIDRTALAASPQPPAAAPATPADGAGELLAVTVRAWADAIGVADLDPAADVFTRGGHSLAALRVAATLSRRIGRHVPVKLLFERPTAASLARGLELWLEDGAALGAASGTGQWPPPADPRVPSAVQLAVLARADRAPAGPGLVAPLAVRLRGALQVEALSAAVAAVARRHEVLRARVESTGSTVRLRPTAGREAAPGMSVPDRLLLVDLSGLGAGAEAAAHRATAALLARPMHPRREPLARGLLLRLAPDDHVFTLLVHRLAGDAWSVELISHELMAHYAAAIRGGPTEPGLRGRPVQYADWGTEQQRRLDSARGAADRRYWAAALSGTAPLVLCTDTGAPPRVSPPHRQILPLGAEVTSGVTRLARAERTTSYVVLLTAFFALLHRWSGRTDLVVGSPTAGRSHPELHSVVGPCADAFAVRCAVPPELPFRELVRAARDSMLEAYDHQTVPFGVLAAERADGSVRHPVFQASIVLQQPPSLLDPAHRAALYAQHPIGGIEVSRFASGEGPMSLDVEVMLFQRGDALEVVFDTHPDAVSPDRAPELAADFLALVAAGVAGPERPVGELLAPASGVAAAAPQPA